MTFVANKVIIVGLGQGWFGIFHVNLWGGKPLQNTRQNSPAGDGADRGGAA